MTESHKLTEHYRCGEVLNDMLRDCLVCVNKP